MDLIQNSLEQASRLLAEFIAEDGNIEKSVLRQDL